MTGVIKSFEESADLKGAEKNAAQMHLRNDSPVHMPVQGSAQFQRLNWNHQLFLISSVIPLETSPICPVSHTACEK